MAGTTEDLVFWDVRNTKVPIAVLDESHNEDVTGARFHPTDPQKVLSCGMDQLLNSFDFEGKASMKEEDTVQSVYMSEQSLVDCGYIPGT